MQGGKWLIHDTKRRKDNQLQSCKFTWKIRPTSGLIHIIWRDTLVVELEFKENHNVNKLRMRCLMWVFWKTRAVL